MSPDFCCSNSAPHGLFAGIHQFLILGGNISNPNSNCRVSVPAFNNRTKVDRENITLHQGDITRNAVDNDFIGRSTDHGRIAVVIQEI